jgi:probable rRNA maturation factor
MNESIPVDLQNHQHEVALPAAWCHALHRAAVNIWSQLHAHSLPGHSLADIHQLDIAFVSGAESDRVHRAFMDIPGATDVITFAHGELILCPAIAAVQAAEHREPLLRELLRYIVHGMLHLAGHLDDTDTRRALMEQAQESIVTALWAASDFSPFSGQNAGFPEE